MKKIFSLSLVCLMIFMALSCSSEIKPSVVEAEKAIATEIESGFAKGQKLADLDILEIGEKGKADFEGPGSQNTFWLVTSRVTLNKVVRQDRFILKDKYYKEKADPVEKKFHVWKNKSGIWLATPAVN